jgi:hypothetical protein
MSDLTGDDTLALLDALVPDTDSRKSSSRTSETHGGLPVAAEVESLAGESFFTGSNVTSASGASALGAERLHIEIPGDSSEGLEGEVEEPRRSRRDFLDMASRVKLSEKQLRKVGKRLARALRGAEEEQVDKRNRGGGPAEKYAVPGSVARAEERIEAGLRARADRQPEWLRQVLEPLLEGDGSGGSSSQSDADEETDDDGDDGSGGSSSSGSG